MQHFGEHRILKKIRDLEDENRQPERMFADLSLENSALEDVIEKSPEVDTKLAAKHSEFGFGKMFLTLRRLGQAWNHK